MNESLFRTPLIEARMTAGVTMPIFIKALTQGSRVIELPSDFAAQPDQLERAAEIVRRHYREYKFHDSMPLAYYAYIASPGRSYRFTSDGRIIGRFHDQPTVAYVQTKGGKRFTFGD